MWAAASATVGIHLWALEYALGKGMERRRKGISPFSRFYKDLSRPSNQRERGFLLELCLPPLPS